MYENIRVPPPLELRTFQIPPRIKQKMKQELKNKTHGNVQFQTGIQIKCT